jgi:hypothetical protein
MDHTPTLPAFAVDDHGNPQNLTWHGVNYMTPIENLAGASAFVKLMSETCDSMTKRDGVAPDTLTLNRTVYDSLIPYMQKIWATPTTPLPKTKVN